MIFFFTEENILVQKFLVSALYVVIIFLDISAEGNRTTKPPLIKANFE